MKGFKEFLLRGNVVELAVTVVIGTAFTAVVTVFTEDILTPLIGAVGSLPDFSQLSFTINNNVFRYGDFINALVAFIITAAVSYFLVVLPMTSINERRKRAKQAAPTTKKCPECLSETPIDAPLRVLHGRPGDEAYGGTSGRAG
jgi:large conductance mechanosensitive channel